MRTLLAVTMGWAVLAAAPVFAQEGNIDPKPAAEVPEKLEGVGIEEKLGQTLDMGLVFKDETGQTVTLGSFFDGKTPVILSPIYYSCPGLCNFHLNGLTEALKDVDWSPGQQFKVLAVSFDSSETPETAAGKKESYMKMYDRPGTEGGWHFLTGDQENVTKFTEAIGFKYKWSEKDREWSHASAAIIADPKGKLTRYLPGIMFDPKDVKLALVEGGKGTVGTFIDQLVLYCFQYNPHQSKYTLYAINLVKLGGLAVIVFLASLILPVWLRSRRRTEA